MKRILSILFLTVAMLFMAAPPAEAHGHVFGTHVFVGNQFAVVRTGIGHHVFVPVQTNAVLFNTGFVGGYGASVNFVPQQQTIVDAAGRVFIADQFGNLIRIR